MIVEPLLATALGARRIGRQWMARCPAHNDRTASLAIRVHADGKVLIHCHAGCTQASVIAALKSLRLWSKGQNRPNLIQEQAGPMVTRGSNIATALTVWDRSLPLRGTIADRYLRLRCGMIPDEVYAADALRFEPECPFKMRTGLYHAPAMIALFRDVVTGQPVGIHRTALGPGGGGKAVMPDGGSPKRMLGAVAGAAVMLTASENVTQGLGITEGIETAVSCMGSGWLPVWAVGSATMMRHFPTLSGVEVLTLFADHDLRGTGLSEATNCAKRWVSDGAAATILMPADLGDWNDVLSGYG